MSSMSLYSFCSDTLFIFSLHLFLFCFFLIPFAADLFIVAYKFSITCHLRWCDCLPYQKAAAAHAANCFLAPNRTCARLCKYLDFIRDPHSCPCPCPSRAVKKARAAHTSSKRRRSERVRMIQTHPLFICVVVHLKLNIFPCVPFRGCQKVQATHAANCYLAPKRMCANFVVRDLHPHLHSLAHVAVMMNKNELAQTIIFYIYSRNQWSVPPTKPRGTAQIWTSQ